MEEVRTPIGAIAGNVRVLGLTTLGMSTGVDVLVVAESGAVKTEARGHISNCATPAPYLLPVFPGQWTVRASLWPVLSQLKEVTVREGETVGLDFVFGQTH